MKALMISADPRILQPDSSARERMRLWASAGDELHIVVFGAAGDAASEGCLRLYPAAGLPAALWCAHSLASQLRPHLITAQGPDQTGLIGYCAARLNRIPFQLQIHTDVLSPWYRTSSWKERVRYGIARFLIPRADCIRAVSRRVSRSLSSNPRFNRGQVPISKIFVLPVFTDLAPFLAVSRSGPSRSGGRFRIAATGRFVDREKNFSMLIDAMRDVVVRVPEAELVLVGDGPERKSYESGIRNYGLGRSVRLLGWRDDLASLYATCDAFVLPSRYEGWGVAVLEAMAVGLPVVMTDVGLAGEILRHNENGLVVPVNDRDALASALVRLARSPDERERLSRAARGTARRAALSKEEYLARLRASFSMCISS